MSAITCFWLNNQKSKINQNCLSINKIVYKIPYITVDDGERLKLLKYFEKEKNVFIPFRSFETYEYSELGNVKKVMRSIKIASK